MLKAFIKAARLRTLPLSVSGIVLGSFLAAQQDLFNIYICILALITTIGFQVVSNFANDYGDGVKGTDNDNRIGPERALQSGAISPKQMLNAIKITSLVTFLVALGLIYLAFGTTHLNYFILFLILGIASIVAAIKYTMGSNPFGYSGYGDIFVFLFFGLLSVLGSYFLYTKELDYMLLLPAAALGLLSAGVLNLNNMRDRSSDEASNKRTLVVKIGANYAKYYHYCLLILALLCAITYATIQFKSFKQFLFLIAFIPILKHVLVVFKNTDPALLDPELKKLALSTFLFAILFGLGHML